jgi:hypothetical protein
MVDMGFDREAALKALSHTGGNIQAAVDHLVSSFTPSKPPTSASAERVRKDSSGGTPIPILVPVSAGASPPSRGSPEPHAGGGISDVISSLDPDEVNCRACLLFQSDCPSLRV